MDNITEAGAGRALDFLLKYRHPDISLNIHFHHSTKKSLSLKRLVEIFREVPQTYFHFESKDFKKLLGSEKELS